MHLQQELIRARRGCPAAASLVWHAHEGAKRAVAEALPDRDEKVAPGYCAIMGACAGKPPYFWSLLTDPTRRLVVLAAGADGRPGTLPFEVESQPP